MTIVVFIPKAILGSLLWLSVPIGLPAKGLGSCLKWPLWPADMQDYDAVLPERRLRPRPGCLCDSECDGATRPRGVSDAGTSA